MSRILYKLCNESETHLLFNSSSRCFVIDTEHEIPLELIVSGKTFHGKRKNF